MSLYGDLPSAKDAGGAPPPGGGSSWSGAVSATMLPPPALRKRALGTAGPPATVPAAVRRRPTEPEAGKTAGVRYAVAPTRWEPRDPPPPPPNKKGNIMGEGEQSPSL